MKTKLRRTLTSFLLILFVGTFATFSYPGMASASYASICGGFTRFGRAGCHGYFTNTNFYTTFVVGQNVLNCQLSARGCVNGEAPDNALPASINTATEFENEIGYYLSPGYAYNHAGAAFIIDAMLGRPGSSFGSTTAGINYAVANFNNWKTNYVDYYAKNGWITWNKTVTLGAGTINSMHNCSINYNCSQSNIASHDGKDLSFFRNPSSEYSHLIIFQKPGTSPFEIRRECANLVGALSPLVKQPPITLNPTCGGVNVNPGMPDPKTAYTIESATVDYGSSAEVAAVKSEGGKFFIDVAGPSVNYTNANVSTTTTGGGKDLTGANVTPGASNNTGTYAVKYGISGTTKPITCTYNFQIVDQPYTTTTGGDTGAGAGMSIGGTDCAVPADQYGGLVGWSRGAAGGYAGAGTQYAALALNHLQDFATAQDGAGGKSSDPTKLAFANTGGVNLGQGLFGGLYGGSACTRDYFANATGVQNGNITISGRAVANGTSKAIYVKGNVYITGNITFSSSYANTGQIPSFDVIVEGNIYIAPNVTELDGLYVAEPTSATNGGIIYTCTQAPFTYQRLNSSLYGNCHSNSLTVDGSFVARQVWFLRAGGSINGSPAESVNFSPEVWLGTPPDVVSGSGGSADTYDAITSLPPIL
jgi:hypothetical protein